MSQFYRYVLIVLLSCSPLSATALNVSEQNFYCDWYKGNTEGSNGGQFTYLESQLIVVGCEAESPCAPGSVPVDLNCRVIAVDFSPASDQKILFNYSADFVPELFDPSAGRCRFVADLNHLPDEISIDGHLSCLSE
jgi:hypothetical protein